MHPAVIVKTFQVWADPIHHKLTILEFVCGVFVLSFIYRIVLTVYNAYLHPLAKFPGPRLAATSQLPYIRALAKGRLHIWIKELHDRYSSDVVRVSPNELSFISPMAWKDITGGRPGHRAFEQDHVVHGKPPSPDAAKSMLTAPHPDHSRMRRVLDHAFSTKAFREQQPVLESYIQKLMTCLRAQANGNAKGKIDLVKWCNWTSFDIIGDFSFGEPFNCLENHANHPWLNTIFDNLKVVVMMGIINRFPILPDIMRYMIPKRARQQGKIHMDYLNDKVTSRIEKGMSRADFISTMLEHNKNGKGLSPGEIRANTALFIVAGSESVVTVTCGAIWYMLNNPTTMMALNAEVRNAFHSEAEIHSQSVLKLVYLTAVMNESLRLYPSTPGLPANRVPKEGSTVSGYSIAGNTGVSISQYAAFRSPRNFAYPDSFAPERWLPCPPAPYADDRRNVFQPFSTGPRACIGKALGDMEVRLMLANLVWAFDFELEPETGEWMEQDVYVTWVKRPLIVKIREVVR